MPRKQTINLDKIASSNYLIGFEFEICMPLDSKYNNLTFNKKAYEEYFYRELSIKLNAGMPEKDAMDEVKAECNYSAFIMHGDISIWDIKINELKKLLPLAMKTSYESIVTGNDWYIKFDDTIKGKNNIIVVDGCEYIINDFGVEISTLAYDINEGISILNMVLEFIKANGYTNESTGLHISINDKRYNKIDQKWLLLAILFNDKFFTKQFNRVDNKFNQSLFRFFKEVKNADNKLNYDYLESEFKKWAITCKNNSINFKHTNYYEFRVFGNNNYEYKFEQLRNDIFILIDEFNKINGDHKKYLKRIASLLYRN